MATPPKQHNLCPLQHNPATPLVAGLDEVTRGCLAGPVVAAAVILPENFFLPQLADSKKISPQKREILAPMIKSQAIAWSLGVVWQKRIDKINILAASLEAMAQAAASLQHSPQMLLLDGNQKIPQDVLNSRWQKTRAGIPPPQKTIVGGDAIIPAISAASVLAKTFRDRLMAIFARHYPGYGFEKHRGYGTKQHLRALSILGPCPLHRLTFKGVAPVGESMESQFELC